MPKFAENTSVGADRSRAEIEKTVQRYGDWAAMGAFSKHWAVNPNSICDECASNPLPNQTTQYEQSKQTK
jgi:hypothetical protein